MIEKYRAIKYNQTHEGRDKIIFDTLKNYAYLNPPALGSSTAASQIEGNYIFL